VETGKGNDAWIGGRVGRGVAPGEEVARPGVDLELDRLSRNVHFISGLMETE